MFALPVLRKGGKETSLTYSAHIPEEKFLHFKERFPHIYTQTMKILQQSCDHHMAKARKGELTEGEALGFMSGHASGEYVTDSFDKDLLKEISRWHLRDIFIGNVSWAVFTQEWIQAIAHLLETKKAYRVLEVCAGNGVLTGPMSRHGFEWIATDIEPWGTADYKPIKSGALDAVKAYKPDVVFWSWWPYISPESHYDDEGEPIDKPQPLYEDHHLVKHCYENGIPIIFVGEGPGGCTGSESLWEGPWTMECLVDPDTFPYDVPQWNGIHDSTFMIRPR